MSEATGRVKIVKLPAGDAPEWVRKAFLGLTLPCFPIMGFPGSGKPEKSLLTGKPITYDGRNRRGISVPQKETLEIMKATNPPAAYWFKSQGFPKPPPDNYFSFGENEVQIISGVVQQELEQHLGLEEIGVGGADNSPGPQ